MHQLDELNKRLQRQLLDHLESKPSNTPLSSNHEGRGDELSSKGKEPSTSDFKRWLEDDSWQISKRFQSSPSEYYLNVDKLKFRVGVCP